jgi:hypothetical protein
MPIIARVLPTPKTPEEAAQELKVRTDQSSANWWMVRLTGLIAAIYAGQLIVFGRQATRLRETIKKMDEIAQGQTKDMQASIREANRAAAAMEGIAVSMALDVAAVQKQAAHMEDGLDVTRKAADAARTSAEISRSSHRSATRPRLVVRPITVEGIDDSGYIVAKLANAKAWITNVGVRRVKLEFFHAQWLVRERLPFNNPERTAEDTSSLVAELTAGGFLSRDLPDFEVPFAAYRSIANDIEIAKGGGTPRGELNLFLIGYLKYRDKIGLRRTYFAFRYDPIKLAFVPEGHPSYNYEE